MHTQNSVGAVSGARDARVSGAGPAPLVRRPSPRLTRVRRFLCTSAGRRESETLVGEFLDFSEARGHDLSRDGPGTSLPDGSHVSLRVISISIIRHVQVIWGHFYVLSCFESGQERGTESASVRWAEALPILPRGLRCSNPRLQARQRPTPFKRVWPQR